MSMIGRTKQGGGGSGYKRDDHLDHLTLFINNESRPATPTRNGPSDAVFSEYVVCLSLAHEYVPVYRDHLTFGTVVVPTIVEVEAPIAIGVYGRGDATAGKSAAWLLFDASDEDEKRAEEWVERYTSRLPSGRVVVDIDAVPQPPAPSGDGEPF